MSIFGQVTGILEDDLARVRMGRVSTEDEALMSRLITGKGGAAGLARIIGMGGSLNLPAYRTTRPVSPAGATTVVFRHKTISSAREYPFDRDAVWFSAPPEVGKAAGAMWDRRVYAPGGTVGAWRLSAGGSVPAGGRAIAPKARVLGHGRGTARQAHRYVARFSEDPRLAPNGKLARRMAAESDRPPDDSAAVYASGPGSTAGGVESAPGSDFGTVPGGSTAGGVESAPGSDFGTVPGGSTAGGVESAPGSPSPTESRAGSIPVAEDWFWDTVEGIERCGGRIQSRVIAELPYEDEIGAWSRAEILERFGALFDSMGLPWIGVVHRPEPGSDARNYHVHILYHTRSASRSDDGRWTFARKHRPETRERGWIWKLRARWAEEVNRELASHGIRRRVDARSYREMGIPKKPTMHLGPAATALERRGVATRKGELVIAAEGVWRFEEAERRYARELEHLSRRAGLVIEESKAWPPPYRRVSRAATDAAGRAGHDLMDAVEGSVRARALADLARWRAEDVPSRLALLGRRDPVARDVALDLGRLMVAAVEPARVAVVESRIAVGERDRAAAEARALMTAERMLEERARAAAALAAARRAVLGGDGRMSETAWKDEGNRVRREALRATAGVLTAERGLLAALSPPARTAARAGGPKDKEWRSRLRRHLDRVLAGSGGPEPERDAARIALDALMVLESARIKAAGWAGSLERWRRTEADGVSRSRRVIPSSEASAQADLVALRAATLAARDAAVAGHPVASRLARERGIPLTSPSRDLGRGGRD